MFSVFGGVAVVLASVGLYGVMSFSVNQRTQEFGIRMALGADHNRILAMVLRQGAIQLPSAWARPRALARHRHRGAAGQSRRAPCYSMSAPAIR